MKSRVLGTMLIGVLLALLFFCAKGVATAPAETHVFIVLRIDQPDHDNMRILIRVYERFADCQAVADDVDEANPADHRLQICEAVVIQKAR